MPKSYPLENIIPAGNYQNSSSASVLFTPKIYQLFLSSLGTKVMRDIHVCGVLSKPIAELVAFFESKGGKLVMQKVHGGYTFWWEDSYVDVSYWEKSNDISVDGLYLNPDLIGMEAELRSQFVSQVKKNLVFGIIKRASGELDIKNLGNGSSPLISDNYLPEVIEDVEFVMESFKKTPPNGRICILNGEPGTGKTHLIRSILTQLDSVFLIIPSNMIDYLDKPEFVPLLMNIRSEHSKAIVLIIEDGDVCLVPRKNDNISTISSLLNLSDGIMGTLMDIKIIISTNADIKEMDQAIMRPGRLCRNIHVGPLPYEQSNKVYQRLMKDETARLPEKRYYTLAEVYNIANNVETEPKTITATRRAIGFSVSPTSEDRTLNKGKIGF